MAEQPMPKSPPSLYAKRRHQAKLQVLEREIGFLEEELKSLDNVQPTSRSCKEINDFVATKPDPLITVNQQKSSQSDCSCSWRISGCSRSDKEHHDQQPRKSCCCSRKSCCRPKCCGIKGCSCFPQNCCLFKLCSSNCCCKVKLCHNCVPSCCGSCC
ncbi:guanine nucleotide-binding protein subunit gamma 3-like [Chenopodium quinoa]|uniref:guanine nucleotide-binding protein subunit gamma 3-like n=1 Tax=Chenopodium quinoa TaxID=63459 RepID=UPI000B79A1FA|nr:guanine nucleotide-binding protein subunit gamma 3-like [Chenopodium quinoa]